MGWSREWGEWLMQMGWPYQDPFPLEEYDFDDGTLDEQLEEMFEGPLLPLREMVFFPRMMSPILVECKRLSNVSNVPNVFNISNVFNVSNTHFSLGFGRFAGVEFPSR